MPRGVLIAPECHFDASYDPFSFPTSYAVDSVEGAGQSIVTRNVDQIVRPPLVSAADVFQPTSAKRSWVALPEVVLDADGVFAPSTSLLQRALQPPLYVAADVFSLPSIAIPGVLQVKLLASDDVLFSPLVVAPGTLRPALFADHEAIHAPMLTAPLTLHPGRLVDSESFPAPLLRGGMIEPPLFVDADLVRPFVTKVSMVAPVVVDADAFPTPSMGVPASLDGRITGVLNMVMSNNNLTATVGSFGAGAVIAAQSASFKTAGKYYFEVTATLFHDIYTGVGISQLGTDYSGMSPAVYLNVARGDIGVSGASSPYTLGTGALGDVYGFAVDLGAGLMWVRRGGGLWNGRSTSDPLTGVTGVSIPTGGNWAPFVRFATNSVAGDNVTANFGQSPYITPAPVGFGMWSTVVAKFAPSVVVDNDAFPATQVGQILVARVTDQDVVYAPVIAGGIVRATLDGETSNVGLSNGGLTATHANTSTDSGARSTALKTSGKYYFEVTMTATHGSFDSVAIITSDATYNDFVSNIFRCVALEKTGAIYANNADSGRTLGACTSGDVVSMAVDLGARLAWLRKNGGNWNGLALSLENPNTGAGGVTIAPSSSFAPAVGFGGPGTAVGDRMDANFGQSAFAYVRPTGFGDWTATVVPLGMPITFDGVPANTALSNGNLTATHSIATGSSGARSATTKATGKYYFEVAVGQTSGVTDSIGLIAVTTNYSALASSSGMAVVRCSGGGAVWQNGSNTGKTLGGNLVAGDVVGVAVDATNRLAWFRKNGGPWNGDATADPVAVTGAVSWFFTNPNPFVGFDGAGTAVGDNFTANFGQQPFAAPAPSGYYLWRVDPTTQTAAQPSLASDDALLAPAYIADRVVWQVFSAAVGGDDALPAPLLTRPPVPPSFINFGTIGGSAGGSTSAGFTMPASIVAGNLLIAEVQVFGVNATISVSGAGWTMGDQVGAGTSCAAWAWKIAVGGDASPTFSWTGAAAWHDKCSQFYGNASSPIGATAHNAAGSGTAFGVGGITTTQASSSVFGIMSVMGNSVIPTPTGFTSRSNFNDGTGSDNLVTETVSASGGSSDNLNATLTGSAAWQGFLIEIKAS